MRDSYVINQEYLFSVDGKFFLKLIIDYFISKTTRYQDRFLWSAYKKLLSKEDQKRIVKEFMEDEITDLILYDGKEPILESYDYSSRFYINQTKKEFESFQKVLKQHGMPPDIFFTKHNLGVIRKKMYRLTSINTNKELPAKMSKKTEKKSKR